MRTKFLKYTLIISFILAACSCSQVDNIIIEEPLKVSTIGDSRFVCCGADVLRKELDSLGTYNIVGSLTDSQGYEHDAIGGDTTENVLNRLINVPEADVYVIHLGTNDLKSIMNESKANMVTIIETLLSRGGKVLFAKQVERNDHNLEFPFTNKHYELDSYVIDYFNNNPDFDYVDLRLALLNEDESFNWSLYADHVHPNEEGAKLMALAIHNKLKKY